nr:MAG TPA: hypothetical protein [Caudoviricetes sp.]
MIRNVSAKPMKYDTSQSFILCSFRYCYAITIV